jgi:Fe-S-cluster-containing dehydrogenase component
MLIEVDRCVGCDICLKACKDEFVDNEYPPYSAGQPNTSYGYGPNNTFGWPNTPSNVEPWFSPGHLWMKVEEQTWGKYPNVAVRYVPKPCMHCDNPPCLNTRNHDVGYKRSDGIVIIDPTKSKNCVHVVDSCPYRRIYLNNSRKIPQKCTFCVHLVEKGEKPRCVEACPLHVLIFGDLDDPDSAVSKKIRTLKAKPPSPEYGTRPNVYYSGFPSEG